MDIKLELVSQDPIDYNGFFIYQPTFGDIRKFGVENFNNLLLPYFLTHDLLNIQDEDQSKIDLFSDVIMKDESLLSCLVLSLHYFCKCNCIWIHEDRIKIRNGFINKDNFKELGDMILQICSRERPKIEKTPKFANERQKDIWEKLHAGRQRDLKRNELHLYDVLNICEFYDYYISMDTIKAWTLWKIMQCYKVKMGVSNYRDSFSIYLISGEKSLIEDKHWSNQIKVS